MQRGETDGGGVGRGIGKQQAPYEGGRTELRVPRLACHSAFPGNRKFRMGSTLVCHYGTYRSVLFSKLLFWPEMRSRATHLSHQF